MTRTFHVIKENWRKNYRHHGGARAVARCLTSELFLRVGLAARERRSSLACEALTFSVVPWVTAVWTRLLWPALAEHDDVEVVIGDCSGGFGPLHRGAAADPPLRVIPCLNWHHGDKIDLFLARVCRAPYVLIADDDVFWLSGDPMAWALDRLAADPRVAAVSLRPRREVSSALRQDHVLRPMGSHCLVIRSELWRRERLSFATAPPPEGADWFYDTGDLANRELLRRGYRVAIAPPEIEGRLVGFDGISTWILKLQAHPANRLTAVTGDVRVRQQKALQAIHFVRGLTVLLGELGLVSPAPEIVPASRLDEAELALEPQVPVGQRDAARRVVTERLEQIRARLLALETGPSQGES